MLSNADLFPWQQNLRSENIIFSSAFCVVLVQYQQEGVIYALIQGEKM